MKSIINKISLGLLVFAVASCTDNYLDINSNPYQPGDLSADDYLLGSAMTNLAGTVVSPDVNTTQFTDCLLGGPLGGYFADSQDGWKNTISNYNPKDDWTRVLMKSKHIIPTLYTNLAIVENYSRNTNNPIPYAIARVIKVATMHRVTDTYGPIPYSKIGENGSISTPYDSQKEVYEKLFEDLNAAIGDLMANRDKQFVLEADYVYGGNVKQWIKFANSLKLRLAIRIAYADPTKSREMAESAVKNEVGLITSNSDNAQWNYFKASENPLYTATRYNSPAASSTGGDTHAAADIICYMNGYKDARRAKYFNKSQWPNVEYVGLRRGIEIPPLAETGYKYSGVAVTPTSPLFWMNAAEVAFLRAEGAALFGFNMGGEAKDFYNQGIRLSFEGWGVEGANTYIENETNTPATYEDPAGTNSYLNALSTVTVKWNESDTPEKKQERIIIQKWIANWQLGNEAWADYRRTGYPRLIPATAAGNKSNGLIDSSKGPRRMPYPQAEYTSTNSEYVKKATAELLGGPDDMATKVWWDAK